ncbi:MAG TPA: mycofactocin biosynthesis glycosyltransferase MftF [Streptosporangiaceae bacterium]|nr:mycofactocin biosynthesis glycosyltransferase MftF [Streptosporangiaceae bacterium]
MAARTATELPTGFGIEIDADTKQLSDGSLFGGSPGRVMRLTAAGAAALAELRSGPVQSAAAGLLARRLTDGGLAHPVPPGAADPAADTVTVVIPVRDRADMLDRCLAATGAQYPVIVIDDGSADPGAIAAVAARHGAALRRRTASGGPAAARNTGLAGTTTDLIAFLDSDCIPPPGWVSQLAAHFADPLVGAVAPRIVAPPITPPSSASTAPPATRYAGVRGSLDLGPRPARVQPGSRVSYVPTAALLVRRAALDAVSAGRDPFDPALRHGEDVDLVWRLNEAGWRIRYDPAVQVPHEGPATWAGLLGRRFSYGTSAAPLACRHPQNLAPLVLQPWPATTVAALLARRPAVAAAALVAAWFDITSAVRRAGVPADGAPAATLTAVHQTWLGIGRYATQFAAPALVLGLVRPGGRTTARRLGRRAAAASLLLGPALTAYAERKPELDVVRFSLAHIADDVCYGAGVWAGCLRERTVVPVRPAISLRPLPTNRPPSPKRRA